MTGIEMIAKERQEQIEKHGWTKQHDAYEHFDGELCDAAIYALTLNDDYHQREFAEFEDKIYKKSLLDRLIIAGALIAAEIDRLQNIK